MVLSFCPVIRAHEQPETRTT